MYCDQCGKELNDNAVFCPYCGRKISDSIPAQSDSENQDTLEGTNTESSDTISIHLPRKLYIGRILCVTALFLLLCAIYQVTNLDYKEFYKLRNEMIENQMNLGLDRLSQDISKNYDGMIANCDKKLNEYRSKAILFMAVGIICCVSGVYLIRSSSEKEE